MLPGRNDAEMGPANSLHASAYYSEYNERKKERKKEMKKLALMVALFKRSVNWYILQNSIRFKEWQYGTVRMYGTVRLNFFLED